MNQPGHTPGSLAIVRARQRRDPGLKAAPSLGAPVPHPPSGAPYPAPVKPGGPRKPVPRQKF